MANNAGPLILLTRPQAAADRFAAACRARFGDTARIVIAPLVDIVTLPDPVDLQGISGLIFTSEAGVSAFAAASARRDLPAWCVGDRTMAAAAEIGLSARSAQGDAEALIGAMRAEPPTGIWLHLHGEQTRGDVVERLIAAGIDARGQAIYAQRPRPPSAEFRAAITGQTAVIAPLFSPLSAERFADAVGEGHPGRVTPVTLSPAIRDALPAPWWPNSAVAEAPNAAAMLDCMARLISP